MDSLHLLARENEFKKLNKQLEKRTESLMKEIEQVMQKQDIFTELSQNLSGVRSTHTKKHCCDRKTPDSTPTKKNIRRKVNNDITKDEIGHTNVIGDGQSCNTNKTIANDSGKAPVICNCCLASKNERVSNDLEFLYAFVSVNVQDKVLPQSFLKDSITVENVCKFLSSKVKLQQEQIDKLQSVINKKASQCEKHMTSQAELESERMSLMNRANNLRAEVTDVKAKFQALQGRFSEKERLYKEQRSETDKLTAELKKLRSKNVSIEARCALKEQSIENLNQQLELAKRTEKEFRDSSRALSASHENAIQRLECRVAKLKSFCDKQSELIENLRRQNALLATEGAIKNLEREYYKYLTQD